jgi:hypothetical protein
MSVLADAERVAAVRRRAPPVSASSSSPSQLMTTAQSWPTLKMWLMPEWLLGLISGVVLVYISGWFQERRERRNRGNQLVAKLHVLVEEVRPGPILYAATLDQERVERAGLDLWRRWRELREPLHVFAFESGSTVEAAVKQVTTHVSMSIQLTRNAIDAADDQTTRASSKQTAEEAYDVAIECVDDLDRAFAGRSLRGLLKSETRRT